jgi:pyruvate dehydrogenase E2 component (dihydrolipoamide acetyltransferase)
MAFEYELPDVGEGIAEGEIVEWHVSQGDRITEDQVMADVETDKAVVDLPAPVTGTLLELHAAEGEMVPVGNVVATIEVEGDVSEEADVESGEPADDTGEAGASDPAAGGAAAGGPSPDGTDADSGDAVQAATGDGRVFAPPNVRRLARELGVDVTAIEGSGPSGRITEADVRSAASDDEPAEPKQAITRKDDTDEADAAGGTTAGADGTEATASSQTAVATTVETADREQTLATPATRGLAREHDVDIDEVPTDRTRDGEAFVEKADIRAFVETQEAAQQPAAEPATGATAESTTAATESGTAAAGTSAESGTAEATTGATAGDRVTSEPYQGIRRTIGQQMEKSAFTAPRASHHDQADVSELVETRETLKERAEEQGVKLTYMPFVIKAIVAALEEYPVLNSELDEEAGEILYKQYYNVGIAVATDAGLMVPVVKNADEKGLLELATEINDLASRARDREISPDEMQDGTFTITNFGAFGGEYALPIINHPETAILGLGSIEQRPVVEDGEVVARHTLPLSLAIDHRVIDGADAAQFANTVIEYLENPTLLLLE